MAARFTIKTAESLLFPFEPIGSQVHQSPDLMYSTASEEKDLNEPMSTDKVMKILLHLRTPVLIVINS